MLGCRVLGHRWVFWRDGATVRWRCDRGCGAGGARAYRTRRDAQRHLRHYARTPRPPVGLLAALAGTVPPRPRSRS
ncbi:MAG TPA: hypothetical protein VFM58_04370 [Solirubrobacteraceae bacterium]|jgi:hypothetical protein|nr:hypothetical protein [Solirubrobacteraceae bacterium]